MNMLTLESIGFSLTLIKRNGEDGPSIPGSAMQPKRCVIGHSAESDVQVLLPTVAEEQCHITLENDQVFLEPLTLVHKTILNDSQIVEKTEIKNKDVISLDLKKFRINIGSTGLVKINSTQSRNATPRRSIRKSTAADNFEKLEKIADKQGEANTKKQTSRLSSVMASAKQTTPRRSVRLSVSEKVLHGSPKISENSKSKSIKLPFINRTAIKRSKQGNSRKSVAFVMQEKNCAKKDSLIVPKRRSLPVASADSYTSKEINTRKTSHYKKTNETTNFFSKSHVSLKMNEKKDIEQINSPNSLKSNDSNAEKKSQDLSIRSTQMSCNNYSNTNRQEKNPYRRLSIPVNQCVKRTPRRSLRHSIAKVNTSENLSGARRKPFKSNDKNSPKTPCSIKKAASIMKRYDFRSPEQLNLKYYNPFMTPENRKQKSSLTAENLRKSIQTKSRPEKQLDSLTESFSKNSPCDQRQFNFRTPVRLNTPTKLNDSLLFEEMSFNENNEKLDLSEKSDENDPKSIREKENSKTPKIDTSPKDLGTKQLFHTPYTEKSFVRVEEMITPGVITKEIVSRSEELLLNSNAEKLLSFTGDELEITSDQDKHMNPIFQREQNETSFLGVKKLLNTHISEKEGNLKGIKELLNTPQSEFELVKTSDQEKDINQIFDSKQNDTNFVGVKELLNTPQQENEANYIGVKEILNSPKLLDVKELLKTHNPERETNLQGLKELYKTPNSEIEQNIVGLKELLNTPHQQKELKFLGIKEMLKSPKNDDHQCLVGLKELVNTPSSECEANLTGVKELLNTPISQKEQNLTGIKELMKTPYEKNDSNLIGIKELLNSPKYTTEKRLLGLKQLFKTPPADVNPNLIGVKTIFTTPKIYLPQNLVGMKELLKTPQPNTDHDLIGVKELLNTPKNVTEKKLIGMKELFKTPHLEHEANLTGVKEIMNTPKVDKEQNLLGLKELLKTPDQGNEQNLSGIKELLNTPKNIEQNRIFGIKSLLKTPKPERNLNLIGVKEILNTPKSTTETQFLGTKELLKTPHPEQIQCFIGVKKMFNTPKVSNKENEINFDGVEKMFNTPKEVPEPELSNIDKSLEVGKENFIKETQIINISKFENQHVIVGKQNIFETSVKIQNSSYAADKKQETKSSHSVKLNKKSAEKENLPKQKKSHVDTMKECISDVTMNTKANPTNVTVIPRTTRSQNSINKVHRSQDKSEMIDKNRMDKTEKKTPKILNESTKKKLSNKRVSEEDVCTKPKKILSLCLTPQKSTDVSDISITKNQIQKRVTRSQRNQEKINITVETKNVKKDGSRAKQHEIKKSSIRAENLGAEPYLHPDSGIKENKRVQRCKRSKRTEELSFTDADDHAENSLEKVQMITSNEAPNKSTLEVRPKRSLRTRKVSDVREATKVSSKIIVDSHPTKTTRKRTKAIPSQAELNETVPNRRVTRNSKK